MAILASVRINREESRIEEYRVVSNRQGKIIIKATTIGSSAGYRRGAAVGINKSINHRSPVRRLV